MEIRCALKMQKEYGGDKTGNDANELNSSYTTLSVQSCSVASTQHDNFTIVNLKS